MFGKRVQTLFKTNWRYFGLVALLLAGASFWSTVTGELTADQVVFLVETELAKSVDIAGPDVTIRSIERNGPERRSASARVMGVVCALFFRREGRTWRWVGILPEAGTETQSVDAYVQTLREQNERAAASALLLINTAQVAAKIRKGHFADLHELTQSGLLLLDIDQRPLRGYRIVAEVSESAYRAYATPSAYPRSGVRSFYSDETLVLRASDRGGGRALATDPPFEN